MTYLLYVLTIVYSKISKNIVNMYVPSTYNVTIIIEKK